MAEDDICVRHNSTRCECFPYLDPTTLSANYHSDVNFKAGFDRCDAMNHAKPEDRDIQFPKEEALEEVTRAPGPGGGHRKQNTTSTTCRNEQEIGHTIENFLVGRFCFISP